MRTCLRGGMIQGKSGDIQPGSDVELEVTEHVMSSRGGSIHGPQEKGTQESGLFSTMIMLVMIAVHDVVLSGTVSLTMAAGVGSGALFISGDVGAWDGTCPMNPPLLDVNPETAELVEFWT